MTLSIRAGTADDVDAVMAIMEPAFDAAFGEAWSRAQCLGMLSLPDVWLDLAVVDDGTAPRGFALSRRVVDEAELLLLAVAPAWRGRGIGAALVARTAEQAAARGARHLMLEMRDGNPAARLYAAAGFDEVGRRAGYYRGAGGMLHDAVTLRRPLDQR